MRLIDADRLVEIISQAEKKFPLDDRNPIAIGNRQCLFWIGNQVYQQPTVYDVDKVVEELEKYGDKFSSENYDDWYAAGVVSDCEEIVKRGGVDEID